MSQSQPAEDMPVTVPATSSPSVVFVSYDGRDRDWVANTLLPEMERAGLRFHHDSEMHYGDDIFDWIDSRIAHSKVAILVLSRNYLENRSFARAEMKHILLRRLHQDLRVVPIFKERLDLHELPFEVLSIASLYPETELQAALRNLRRWMDLSDSASPPDGISKRPGAEADRRYIPPERRIRVQASRFCDADCTGCHFDEFEKGVVPQYDRVLRMMGALVKGRDADRLVFPRPNIEFALTGGEPLKEQRWQDFVNMDPANSYLITNARALDPAKIDVIAKAKLRRIRISINEGPTLERHLPDIIANVTKLVAKVPDVEIRFNRLVTRQSMASNFLADIDGFVELVTESFPEALGKQIKGIAFIQEAVTERTANGGPSPDIFDLARKAFAAIAFGGHGSRKAFYSHPSGLKIEFIKLNCDTTDNYFRRCFACAQERDIAIAADARIRVCSRWNPKTLAAEFNYAHVDENDPLMGISGMIRRTYGLAGFYAHFPLLVDKLESLSLPTGFTDDIYGPLRQKTLAKLVLRGPATQLAADPRKAFRELLVALAKTLLAEPPVFGRLYEEGTYDEPTLARSTDLCELLVRAAFDLAGHQDGPWAKSLLNATLLVLTYLCVDESLFSTARSAIVRGMARHLIEDVAELGVRPWDREPESFLLDSAYYLGTVAFENVDPEIVRRYLHAILGEQRNPSSSVSYLEGCIYRQMDDNANAIEAFQRAYQAAEVGLQTPRSAAEETTWLHKEIRAEALRSIAAITKKTNGQERLTRETFLKAAYLGASDTTRLQYMSLFSDGYASLINYFKEEFALPDRSPEEGYRAYICFQRSTELNPEFYGSLIRMALLETALGRPDNAIKRLRAAQRIFSRRGLLTDLEYLNGVLCSFILATARFLVPESGFDVEWIPRAATLSIRDCRNVGLRDAQCVADDLLFLRSIINREKRSELPQYLRDLRRELDNAVDDLGALATKKK